MRWRLIAVFIALTALVLLVQDIPLAYYLRSIESNRIAAEIQRDGFLIAGRGAQTLASGNASKNNSLDAVVDEYAASNQANVVVVAANGTVVANSENATSSSLSTIAQEPQVRAALAGQTASGESTSDSGQQVLYVTVPIVDSSKTIGAVRLTYPAAKLDARVNSRLWGLALAALLALTIAGLVAVLLAGTITRTLRRIQRTTARLASGDLNARAPTNGGAPEIRALATDLNSMADRLNSLVESQRSFAADASHQLRTPLTALRLRLDEAADKIERDPTAGVESLDAARAETERLQRVIDGLLRLARAEGAQPARTTIDLVEITKEQIDMWHPLAEECSVTLSVTAPATAPALGFDGASEQILDNYIDNAISVSPAGSRVDVIIDPASPANGGRVVLTVRDCGPGLTANQRERAFDRFWRGREGNAGTGLGLAIVSQLADACGAQVELRESPTGGIDAVASFIAA